MTLIKYTLPGHDSVGNDGSPAVLYLKMPRFGGTQWFFHLQGGGGCYSLATCAQRAIDYPNLMTYSGLADTIGETGAQADTQFANWGLAYLHYGSSDWFAGQGASGNWQFRGGDILYDCIEYIAQYGISELILSGGSAGGVGVLLNIDWVARMLPNARVSGYCDAGWIIDQEPYDVTYDSACTQITNNVTYCRSCRSPDEYFSHYFHNLAKKNDIFVHISQRDGSAMALNGIPAPASKGKTEAEIMYIDAFAAAVIASLTTEGVTGYYCPNDAHHVLLLDNWNTDLITIGGIGYSLADVFSNWYFNLGTPKQLVGPYVGVVDTVTGAIAAYSVARLLRVAYTGPLIRLRESVGNTESDFYPTAAGHLNTNAVNTFLNGASGYIKTIYDQSGNGYDVTQATTTKQPLYVGNSQYGRAVARFDGVGTVLVSASFSSALSQPNTVFVAGKTNAAGYFFDGNALANRHLFGASATQLGINAGSNLFYTTTIPTGFALWSLVFNTTTSEIFQNAVSKKTGSVGTKTMPAIRLGLAYDGTNPLDGDIEEVIVYNSALSTADRQAVETNINTELNIY